jgi:ribonuclease T1
MTPGIRGRGPRRIVTGSRGEFYYTDDHYRTFKRIVE